MVKILLIILGMVAILCLFGVIAFLLASSGECQLPDIEDIEVVEDMV
jgi:energy-converting hydrogenase Eha subunit H